jgi:hypothetical protein
LGIPIAGPHSSFEHGAASAGGSPSGGEVSVSSVGAGSGDGDGVGSTPVLPVGLGAHARSSANVDASAMQRAIEIDGSTISDLHCSGHLLGFADA